jgi:hypothetical protein
MARPALRTSKRRSTVKGARTVKAAPDESNAFRLLGAEPDLLESTCYYDLPVKLRKAADVLEKSGPPQGIEGWSFVPHPDVFDSLVADSQMRRYIFTIDTLRSAVYFPVLDLLRSQTANISSYYSGGWADFICDGYLTPDQFENFRASVLRTMKDAGITKWGSEHDAITVFEVIKPIVVCGHVYDRTPRPDKRAIQKVLDTRLKFEQCFRNYRSKPAERACGGAEGVADYVRWLKEQSLVLCFRVITDTSHYANRDYVPMMLSNRSTVISNILNHATASSAVMAPIRELLEVTPRTESEEEREITHICVNVYAYPGQRHEWKSAVYKASQIDVNLYNYPLEGTINESPTYISDLPESLAAARGYRNARSIELGSLSHPLLHQDAPTIALPLDGLHRHGVSLGQPGTGKTNADVVIASGATKHLGTVIILDASLGIRDMSSVFEKDGNSLRRELLSKPGQVDAVRILHGSGSVLVECKRDAFPSLVSSFLSAVQAEPDVAGVGSDRKLKGLLLIEEAADGIRTDGDVEQIRQTLDKAYRKGWSIWFSLQRPSGLGKSRARAAEILGLLGNRIILRIDNEEELRIVADTFRSEGVGESAINAISTSLRTFHRKGQSFCRGVKADGEFLPPVPVQIRRL